MNSPDNLVTSTTQYLIRPDEVRLTRRRSAAVEHAQLFLIIKATRLCNLRCTYCNAWREGPNQIMPVEMMARVTEQALGLPSVKRVDFVWHGGETTLLPVSYFETALELQTRHRGNRHVANTIQTNATLLNERWIELFRNGQFAVGVSLDVPPERHARNRRTKGGRDSWQASLDGIRQLKQAGVNHGVLVVVTPELVDYGAQRFLACLAEHDLTNVALLNVLPENTSPEPGKANYLDWGWFVRFLIDVYVEREAHYRGRVTIRELETLAGNIEGASPQVCVLAGNCMGQFLTIEPSGDVSACDKYINDASYGFGSLANADLGSILAGRRLAGIQQEYAGHASKMAACPYYRYCRGSCPHDQYLLRKVQPGRVLDCCGLAPLIEVMQQHRDRGVSTARSVS